MALMQWSSNYETKIEKIDEQHKELVDILNSLHDSMMKGESKGVLGSLLEKLVKYTVVHFKTEEELFEKHSYPETLKHKEEHKELANKASQILSDYKNDKPVISAEIMYFLKDWLRNHILGSDKDYAPFLLEKVC